MRATRQIWPAFMQATQFWGQNLPSQDVRPTLDTRALLKGVLHDHMQVPRATLAHIFPQSDTQRAVSLI